MRQDMARLLTLRRRPASQFPRDKSMKTRKKLDPRVVYDDTVDTGPVRVKSSRTAQYSWTCKGINDYLNPLYRFLEKNHGRPWSEVYSEIRSQIDHRTLDGNHLLEHLDTLLYRGDQIKKIGNVYYRRSCHFYLVPICYNGWVDHNDIFHWMPLSRDYMKAKPIIEE